jgi:hypothetical protein
MRWRLTDRSTRLRLISHAILVVGLLGAIVIYWNASQVPESPPGYTPEDSKQYLRQMELYGGKANVLAFELRQWIDSLWHGKRLAFTVGFVAVLLAAGFRVAAIPLPPLADSATGAGSDPPPGGTDT